MWVKICGNTNLEDAVNAAAAGADALGFIFAESKRRVTAEQIAAITPHLPVAVERVGVFTSRDAEEIAGIALEAGLTAVQLHGGLQEDLLEALAARLRGEVQMIQTVHWIVGTEADGGGDAAGQGIARELERIAELGMVDRVLIDSKVGSAGGGTGVAYDWSAAQAIFAAAPARLRLIVAGGLRAENVAMATDELKPWGVDVSSGVETLPGRKDAALVKLFIQNARG